MIYIVCGIIILVVILLFCYYQNNKIDITNYKIESININNPVVVVQLSDLHSKPSKNIIKKLGKIKPDIIMITGDYINERGKNKEKMLAFGKQLLEFAPVVYITGNHERRLEYFENLMSKLSEIGFTVLLNNVTTLNINNNLINVLGLDENQADHRDYRARKNGTFVYPDMKPYFELLDEKKGFKLVLSHFPENFIGIKEHNYSQYDFDIQLSGHAHGGQFILPFIGPIFSPGQGIFPKYAKGSFGNRPMLIISRGLGNSEFPLRLFNHPEINVITLINNKK